MAAKRGDITGQKFNYLVAQRPANRERNIHYDIEWEFLCTRNNCGKLRIAFVGRVKCGSIKACESCAKELGVEQRLHKRALNPDAASKTSSDFIRNYKTYRAAFTPEQQAAYDDIMEGRENTRTNQAEAVDVICREPQPGVCCKKCLHR